MIDASNLEKRRVNEKHKSPRMCCRPPPAEKGTRYTRHDDWQIIRAELLRLAKENVALKNELAVLQQRIAKVVTDIDAALGGAS